VTVFQAADGNTTADEAERRTIINILIEIQKQAEANVGLRHVSRQLIAIFTYTACEFIHETIDYNVSMFLRVRIADFGSAFQPLSLDYKNLSLHCAIYTGLEKRTF